MRLVGITAVARPEGNGIDLAWTNPDPVRRPGVRVVRRRDGHPAHPDDGTVVADAAGLARHSDTGLRGETVYYYGLFPYAGDPREYDPDPRNRVSATALSPYDFAGLLYSMLPSIYRRYDAAPGDGAGDAGGAGPLRRFLDLPGSELDRLYSSARILLRVMDVDRVDGALLPLLAHWIGWRTNHTLPVQAQRNEIRFAPRVYQTIGGLDAVGATVARVTGWGNRTKEYVHNVARTNQPERLNLWSVVREAAGAVSAPEPASVNFSHDGRPALVREADGSVLAIYHTHRRHGSDIWAKRHTADGGWQPSAPLVDRPGTDKHPSAARAGNRLWLFWQTQGPAAAAGAQDWRLAFVTRTGRQWSAPEIFGDPGTERRMPAVVADDDGVWLFWLERMEGAWRLRYNRHDGDHWQLATPQTFPLDGKQDPRVEEDLHVLCRPGATDGALWAFWTRQEPAGPPGQTRRSIAFRVKRDLDPAILDWSPVRTVPKSGAGTYHDRQPYALAAGGDAIELTWSTTLDGGPTVVSGTLDPGQLAWSPTRTVVGGPHAGRAPAAVDIDGGRTLFVYRSERSIAHTLGALQTLDSRYSGTTTVDTRWTAKLALRGAFEDFQTYVYDAGARRVRTNDDRIARDTVGLFLEPDTTDPDEVRAAVDRLAETLRNFMPVTARAVFVTP